MGTLAVVLIVAVCVGIMGWMLWQVLIEPGRRPLSLAAAGLQAASSRCIHFVEHSNQDARYAAQWCYRIALFNALSYYPVG